MNNFDFVNNMRKENENESQDSVDRRKLTHKIYTIAIKLTVIALSLLGMYGSWRQSYCYVLMFAICMTVLIAIEISVFFWTFNWNLIYGNIIETIVTIIAWIFWNMIRKRQTGAQTMH
jgi:amino acid permease